MNTIIESGADYQSPKITLFEIRSEGILCGSTNLEDLNENEGDWGTLSY